jgi:hypothetical protein
MSKHERKIVDDDGSVSIWYYDSTRFTNGPYKVEIQYSQQFLDEMNLGKRNKKKQKA